MYANCERYYNRKLHEWVDGCACKGECEGRNTWAMENRTHYPLPCEEVELGEAQRWGVVIDMSEYIDAQA